MESEGWQPDWPTLDVEIGAESSTDPDRSAVELSRAFDFEQDDAADFHAGWDDSFSPSVDAFGPGLANFWTNGEAEPEPSSRSKPGPSGPKPPEIPGYEILGELGRGAMGVVYRARQVRLNRIVALKMILAGDHAGPDTLARFMAEAATIARLRHPHIVQIHSIGDHQGRPFVELEYVEGGSLGQRLDGTPWPPRSAAKLLESLARAAGEAHRLGIVHRDLKPANILMTDAGEPKISDFGLAKSIEEDSGLTRTESILGSPNYMAPEQAEGKAKDVGPSADLYALGANLFELLTGRPPFLAPTILATLDLVKNAEPVPPRKLQPLIPRDLETICLKCLEKEPTKRYETADALADDLAAFLADEPIKARRSTAWERSSKWVRRRPSTAALILVSTLAVVALVVGLVGRRVEMARLDAQARRDEAALRSQIDRYVLMGREGLRRGEWENARTQFSSALALIRSELRLIALKNDVAALLNESDRKIAESRSRSSARERFASFQVLYDEAVFYQSDYTGLDAEANTRAGRASATEALAKFGLTFGAKRSEAARDLAPDPRHFDARELAKIDAGCYELLLLLADSVALPLPGEDPKAQDRRALEILEAVRLRGKTSPAYHLRMAVVLERSGDRSAAESERQRARDVAPEAWSAVDHFLNGELAYRRKDFKRAVESFRHALAIQPDRFWAQYFLAVCLLKEHRASEALAALIACQSRRPGFTWAYLLKGFAEGELGEFDLAEEDFRRAGDLRLNDQERYVMLVNRGVMRIRRGRELDAVDDLTRAIALKPGQFEAYINLASARQSLGQVDEALATLGRAIAEHPREAVLYRARSQVYRQASRTREAVEDLRRAVDLVPVDDPTSAGDHLELAVIEQQSGRFEESVASCDRALRLKPNRGEVHRVRGIS